MYWGDITVLIHVLPNIFMADGGKVYLSADKVPHSLFQSSPQICLCLSSDVEHTDFCTLVINCTHIYMCEYVWLHLHAFSALVIELTPHVRFFHEEGQLNSLLWLYLLSY